MAPSVKECYMCGAKGTIHRHHVDWHHNHHDDANIIYLCARCHCELHKVGYLSQEELKAIRVKVIDRESAKEDTVIGQHPEPFFQSRFA